MTMTLAQFRQLLDVDEPDYSSLVPLASKSMGLLKGLAASDNPSVVAKAVSLAGLVGGPEGTEVVRRGAASHHVAVRVAAAHAASFLIGQPGSESILERLLGDKEPGVVKFAARSAAAHPAAALRARAARTTRDLKRRIEGLKAAAGRKRASPRPPPARAARGEMPGPELKAPKKGRRAGGMPPAAMQ